MKTIFKKALLALVTVAGVSGIGAGVASAHERDGVSIRYERYDSHWDRGHHRFWWREHRDFHVRHDHR